MRIQSGRLCKLEFTNLVTKKKFTIDQKLRISFEFFKSADENTSSSTGKITIFGLTQATAEKLGGYVNNNFQTEVGLSVGYEGDKDNFQTLFYAGVTSEIKYTKGQGTSETTMNVSANFRSFRLGVVQSKQYVNTSIKELLKDIGEVFNGEWAFDLSEDQKPYKEEILKLLEQTTVLGWSFSGTLGDYLKKICDNFGLSYFTKEFEDGVKHYVFYISDQSFVGFYTPLIEAIKANKKVQLTADNKTENYKKDSMKVLYEDKDSNTAVVLNYETGLVEQPYLDSRNVKVPYDTKVSESLVVERKAIKAVVDKKTGEQKKDKEGNLRWTKPPKKITVYRRFLAAKALINPDIKPFGMVRIDTGNPRTDGLYRVRNCKFTGDTHGQAWYVEMELEDTSDFTPEFKRKALAGEDQEIEVLGGDEE